MQWSSLQAFRLFVDTFGRWPLASKKDEIKVVECWLHGQSGGKRGSSNSFHSYVISIAILHTVFCTFLMNLQSKFGVKSCNILIMGGEKLTGHSFKWKG